MITPSNSTNTNSLNQLLNMQPGQISDYTKPLILRQPPNNPFQNLFSGFFGSAQAPAEQQGYNLSPQQLASIITESVTKAVTAVVNAMMEKVMALVSSIQGGGPGPIGGAVTAPTEPANTTGNGETTATGGSGTTSASGETISVEQNSEATATSETEAKKGFFERLTDSLDKFKDLVFGKETSLSQVFKEISGMLPGGGKLGKLLKKAPRIFKQVGKFAGNILKKVKGWFSKLF